jgi:putative effector of murein hydrolase LrgA (UPF0299 family)
MRLEQNAVHRKIFSPWYDTESMCLVAILFSVLVFLFCLAGISVCNEKEDFQNYIWFPTLLMMMSSGLFLSLFIRLIRRYVTRYRNRNLNDLS